jgi:cystathionine beta-lyase/cystathionine gamma-synthase
MPKVLLNPKRLAVGDGYHGCHGVIAIHTRLTGMKKLDLDCAADELGEGDVIHLETPLNPTGEALSIAHYAKKAHARGAYLIVDATFGPPGLQDPFSLGADIVMHSGTKYIGGHSDMLCGVLAVQRKDWKMRLWSDRVHLGSVMGSLEGWLGVRSIRTLELRVERASSNATKLAIWLDGELKSDAGSESIKKVVNKVKHASLQKDDWLPEQMPNGFGPVFAIWMETEAFARKLPTTLHLFQHATSLGGVESLIEWRRMSDEGVDPRLMRISIGIENFEDLKQDLIKGFEDLAKL